MRTRVEIYCDIMYWGLLQIRSHANDSQRCFVEADHLHNIPALLRDFQNENLHKYYWEVMRPCFIEHSKPEWLLRFQELWEELEEATLREQSDC